MSDNGNTPARPTWDDDEGMMHLGMTLREHFAGLAMQGWLATAASVTDPDYRKLAVHSIQAADALLKELEK